jgi:putative heme-binding domain-containing protein
VLFGVGPAAGAVDLNAAKEIFQSRCALCHGLNGGGGRGPDLRRPTLTHAANVAEIQSVIENGIWPDMPPAWYLDPDELASIAAYVRSLGTVPPEKLPGDPQRGKLIYARSACASCHVLNGAGAGIGPDLTGVGSRRGAAQLRQTILDPAKAMPDGFLLVDLVTPGGEAIRGIRLNEDTFTIQIRDLQGGIHSFRKADLGRLDKLRNQTPMPAFGSQLAGPDLEDLIAYLTSERGRQ